NYNPRKVPATAGLQAQKKLSLNTAESWGFDVLSRGYVYKARLGLEDIFGHWEPDVATALLFDSYVDYANARHKRRLMTREDLGKFMRTAVLGSASAHHVGSTARNLTKSTSRWNGSSVQFAGSNCSPGSVGSDGQDGETSCQRPVDEVTLGRGSPMT